MPKFLPYCLLAGVLVVGISAFSACSPAEHQEADPPPPADFILPYRLDQPDTVLFLPAVLHEISGLALSPNGAHILAVNDEQGVIFYLNPESGAIERTRDFGQPGDYEGIAVVGTDIYIVKSNGTLYRVPETGETETLSTPLSRSHDVEGLCYDSAQHRLLLACKAKAGKGSHFRHKKALYAFDLTTKKLAKAPAYLLDRSDLARRKGGNTGFVARVLEFFESNHAASAFGPSGVAFCPLNGNLYIIASVGKTLAVVHSDGQLLHAERLAPTLFPQPEGLCFDRSGRLFIASEGGKGRGRVLRFSPVASD